MLNFEFNKNTTEFLKIIAKNALKQKTRVFFVGGLVRDIILEKSSLDVDILVLGNAIEFAKLLPRDIKIKSIHKDFYTVKVLYKNETYDIASTRKETYPYSGCLPVVEKIGVELAEDVIRRDFSVNSIYCELSILDEKLQFNLIDLVQGVNDIKNKKLRVLHSRSYIDDPTRILRGVDFKYRFGFDFSLEDKKLIDDYILSINRENLSFDRTLSVFKKIFSKKQHSLIFKEIVEKKYYKILFDSDLEFDFNQIEEIILKFDLNLEEISDFYILLLQNQQKEKKILTKPIQIYNFFSKFNKAHIAYYFYKTQDKNTLLFLEYNKIKLFLTGSVLLSLGYKQGKIFSEILNSLLNEKMSNPECFSNIDCEINWVKTNFPII